jgi:hypothetical protein
MNDFRRNPKTWHSNKGYISKLEILSIWKPALCYTGRTKSFYEIAIKLNLMKNMQIWVFFLLTKKLHEQCNFIFWFWRKEVHCYTSLHENPLVRRQRPVNLRLGQWKLKIKKSDWLFVFIKPFIHVIYFRGPVKIIWVPVNSDNPLVLLASKFK